MGMGPSAPAICIQHLTYMKWADDLLLEAIATHLPQEIHVLQHIYLGELVWLRRVQGHATAQITDFTAPADLGALRAAWPALHRDWLGWAHAREDWNAPVDHRNLKGQAFQMPAWQIVLHLSNHGSYHRGQVSATLRAAGIAPPSTDLIVWFRQNPVG
jgi:uncharacterized damage-inducible protein DinB